MNAPRLLSLALCFALIWPALGQVERVDSTFNRVFQRFLSDTTLHHAAISFYAEDIDSGKSMYRHNAEMSLVPASVQKLVTTATALELLGGGHRVKTRVEYDGWIDKSCVLHGNIYLIGGGDPALAGKRFKKRYEYLIEKWADAIQQLGIDSIDGQVIGDARIFSDEMSPTTWAWGDLGNYYGAGPSGLSIHENTMGFEFRSGPKKGDSTWVECTHPYYPGLEVMNRVHASNVNRDQAYITGAPYDELRVIRGGIPKGKDSFLVKGAIPDPAYLAAFELESQLAVYGIKTKYAATTFRRLDPEFLEVRGKRKSITHTYSPALSSLVYHTNQYSVNLYAEHILNFVGLKLHKRGATTSGANAVQKFWKQRGINTVGMYVSDGSGLSRFNALSAKHLSDILKYMASSEQYNTFNKSLPVAGVSGTLRTMCVGTAAAKNLRAKSGTMTRVKCYAGYVTTKSGRNLSFAILINNFSGSAFQVKKKIEKVMVGLAEINY